MSERMTDTRRWELRGYLDRQYVKEQEAKEINEELDRARASEDEKMLENARLLNEREAMEGQIKALADVLEHVSKASVNERVWNDATGRVDDMQEIVRAALRLAGRL